MDFGVTFIFTRLVCGLVIGFAIGMTGIGGGVLVLPTLTVLFGLPVSVAVGTACMYALLTRVYAAYEHHRLGTVDWPVSVTILLGAVPGNIAAAMFVNRYATRYVDNAVVLARFQHNLQVFVAFVLLVTTVIMAIPMVFGGKTSAVRLPSGKTGRRISGVLVGSVIGGLVGMTSIGGGVLLIPALIVLFGLHVDKTVGSSVVISVVLVLVSALIYGGHHQIDYPTAVTMFAGSIGGVFIGSHMMVRVSDRAVLVLVLALMVIATVTMFVGTVR